jgi:hypothetical protein
LVPPERTCRWAASWSVIGWRNERTTAILWAHFASIGKVPPNVTPGSDVFTSPVRLW